MQLRIHQKQLTKEPVKKDAMMEEVHCLREEVEAFFKACNLPNAPDDEDVNEFGDDEGFEDDELLFE